MKTTTKPGKSDLTRDQAVARRARPGRTTTLRLTRGTGSAKETARLYVTEFKPVARLVAPDGTETAVADYLRHVDTMLAAGWKRAA